MEGYMGNGRGIAIGTTMRGKLKRKDIEELDQVSHDFSDFSLSSPARKIRRLDAELPPIMEEEEPEIFTAPPSPSPMVGGGGGGGGGIRTGGGIVIEELDSDPDPSPPHIDDKAIILFNPANPLLMHRSPSNFSVDSNIISGFKDQFIRSAQYGQQSSAGEDDETVRNSNNNSNECRAVVPWTPSLFLPPASGMEASQALTEPLEEVMEAEDTMEIEGGAESLPQGQSNHGYGGIWGAGEGLPQWQQQHCMIPHPPHHTSTPITWFK